VTLIVVFARLGQRSWDGRVSEMEYEFSDGFDAVAWHMTRMSRPDYDPYYDEDGE